MDRRGFLRRVGAAAATSTLLSQFWHELAHAATVVGPGPYGPLGVANADGVQVPAGFTARIVATSGQPVAGTPTVWHTNPDGGACFARPAGGWVYVSNSEMTPTGTGGVSAIAFDADGQIADSYRILTGSTHNCSGGPTPWGTWLSCEEIATGHVWECDPQRAGQGVMRPAMGTFNHEAAAVDPTTSIVYLTEDATSGRLYRFTPTAPGDLSAGTLEAASVSGSAVTWRAVSATAPARGSNTTAFNGGEGAWVSGGSLFFTTKGDNRVWELVLATQRLTVLYNAATLPSSPLRGVDNITGHAQSGDLYVAEDGGNMELCVLALDGAQRVVSAFARVAGHDGSEITGPAFSPDGSRVYFSSQRGFGNGGVGVTYEITGPFRGPAAPSTSTVSFVGAAAENSTTKTPGARVPTSVQVGDSLLFIVTANTNATLSTPAGWTLRGTVADPQPDTRSWLFSRTAAAGIAGARVQATMSVQGKVSATVLAHRGAASTPVTAGIEDAASSTTHRSPSLASLPAGSWVVSYWADESAGNTGWTPPAGQRVRSSSVGSGSGRITAIACDVGPLAAGAWTGAVATSTASSRKSVSWSIGLVPA